jgi:hypothetical protein
MQSPVVDGTTDLPAPVAAALTTFVSAAQASLDSDLRAIVLFGSGAENHDEITNVSHSLMTEEPK